MAEYKITSKKADAKIYSWAEAFKPGITKFTTYDQAWEIITGESNITCSLYTHDTAKEKYTEFKLIKKDTGDVIHSWKWDNELVWYPSEGDWNWTYIFKTALDYIITNKLIKKPRKKRANTAVKTTKVDKCKEKEKEAVKSAKNNVKSKSKK